LYVYSNIITRDEQKNRKTKKTEKQLTKKIEL